MYRWPLVCAAVISVVGSCLSAAASDSPWTFRAWRSDDGLPNNCVTGIVQSADGYLWIGTYSCLARFDGVRFVPYSQQKLAGVDTSKITAVQLARDGSLWIGCLHGQVVRLDSGGVKVFSAGLPEKQVQAIVEDADGAFWISYTHQASSLYRLKGDQVSMFSKAEGVPSPQLVLCSICADKSGRVWFAKDGVVGEFRKDHFDAVLHLGPGASRLAPSSDGGLWICVGSRLYKYSEKSGVTQFGGFETVREDTQPTALLEDARGEVWIGTSDSGLFHYRNGTFEQVPISDVEVSSLCEDRDGHLWVGTGNGGLNLVAPRVVSLETTESGLPFNAVRSTCQDSTGAIWATTQNDLLVRREAGHWNVVPLVTKTPNAGAFCVAADRTEGVWIGTRDFEVIHLARDGSSSWGRSEGLLGRDTRGLLPTRDGDLWIVESGPDSLQRLHGGRLETYPLPANAHLIRTMVEDSDGRLWLGTTNGILISVFHGELVDRTALSGGALKSIRSLLATKDGSVWIGYADDGLGWIHNGRISQLGTAEGFPENNLSQIIDDGQGWLWFGGDHGIFKAREEAIKEAASGRPAAARYVRYGRSDGLFSMEAGFGSAPGASRSLDGRLWIPMQTALCRHHSRSPQRGSASASGDRGESRCRQSDCGGLRTDSLCWICFES